MDIKGTLDLITRVDLSETAVRIELDTDKINALLETELNKLDLEFLRIEEPSRFAGVRMGLSSPGLDIRENPITPLSELS